MHTTDRRPERARTRLHAGVGLLLVGLAGCTGPTTAPPPTAQASPAIDDPTQVLRVDLELDAADWAMLTAQSRHGLEVLGDSCHVAPPQSPYTWFEADAVVGHAVERVGVRKKGFFGSQSDTKPSLKIDTDRFVDGLRLDGREHLTLNNNLSDPSQVRQCIAYGLMARVYPAPSCTLATVAVNGVPLGLYSNVEPLKKRFLRAWFEDDDGLLYEGAFSDFRPLWVESLEPKGTPDPAALNELVAALELPDEALMQALDALVDLEAFATYWSFEVLLTHGDGYARSTNNFYVYRPPGGRWVFLPWGMDTVLGPDRAWVDEVQPPPGTAWAQGALAHRLYRHPEGRTLLLDRLRELLDSVWDEQALLAEVDRLEQLLAPELALYPAGEQALILASLDEVRTSIRARRGQLEPALAAPPAWDAPLRPSLCIEPVGHVTVDLVGDQASVEGDLADEVWSGQVPGTFDGTELQIALSAEYTLRATVLADRVAPGRGSVQDASGAVVAVVGGGSAADVAGALHLSTNLYPP